MQMRTIYVMRETEDLIDGVDKEGIKPKSEGGEVDAVIYRLDELVGLLE